MHVREPLGRVGGKCACDEPVEGSGELGPQVAWRAPSLRRLAGEQLVEHRADGEDVGPLIERFARRLLRRRAPATQELESHPRAGTP